MDQLPDDLRPEYDLPSLPSRGRGVFHAEYLRGTNMVRVDADLHRLFPDSEAVNRALRAYAEMTGLAPGAALREGPADYGPSTKSTRPVDKS